MLAAIPVQDIVRFLDRVGTRWKAKEHSQRRPYERALQRYSGFSPAQAELIAVSVALTLTSRTRMHDLLDTDLGDRLAVDNWCRREDVSVRGPCPGASACT